MVTARYRRTKAMSIAGKSYMSLPHLPNLFPLENRYRLVGRDGSLLLQGKSIFKKSGQGVRSDSEGRTLFVVVEVEEPGELASWAHQFGHLLSPLRPHPARERAQECSLIDDVERSFLEREEVRLSDAARKLAELDARGLERRVRAVARQ